jgi:hypothetical protein
MSKSQNKTTNIFQEAIRNRELIKAYWFGQPIEGFSSDDKKIMGMPIWLFTIVLIIVVIALVLLFVEVVKCLRGQHSSVSPMAGSEMRFMTM